METGKLFTILFMVFGLMVCLPRLGYSEPMGTAFTYQGRLIDANDVADGLYDFQFKLFDSITKGKQVGTDVNVVDVDVIDGYFTAELDFGKDAFDGEACWLQIGVRPGDLNDPNEYTVLEPRQEVTPTPYALYAGNIIGDSDWVISDSNMYSGVSGDVGIGTTSPISRLEVMATENQHGIRSTVPYIAVYGHRTGTSGTWPAIHGECDSQSSNASGVRGVITSTSPGSLSAGVRGINNGTGGNGVGVRGYHDGSGYGVYGHTAGNGIGVYGVSNSNCGVYGVSDSSFGVRGLSSSNYGVYGFSSSSYGVCGVSSSDYGVRGYNSSSGHYGNLGGSDYGVYGETTGDSVDRCAVYGRDKTSANTGHLGSAGMGVYGYSISGDAVYGHSHIGYAGYFRGDVRVTGNLTKGGGSFRIDHPLDPENKYLQHSFVESPDMMNVYNGNVVLDKDGEASVQLPEYFQALNRDFRYQLTAIGTPAPNLHIAQEISNNRFKIAGGEEGTKVSWQVTGIRKDPYAVANRIAVEEDKPEYARGYYLHPEVYGQPEDRNIGNAPNPQLAEQQQVIAKYVQQ